jgi:F-type H+-transporting ATPase subunit gamma
MAGGQERILRRRIRTVQSTKKITRAMELIAASRIVRAQARVHAARPYSEQITQVIRNLASGGAGVSTPLLQARPEVKRVAVIVVTADRGLCGAYNSSVIRAAERAIVDRRRLGQAIFLVTVGRKAESYFRYREYQIDASFHGFSDSPSYEDARAVAAAVAEPFAEGTVDLVLVFSTLFLSAGTQVVAERPLMPLDPGTLGAAPGEAEGGATATYEFEPGPDVILDRLLPRYVEARLFAAFLEAAASEHAARQRAMKAATDNADELIKGLSRVMNRARQDSITTEIMEIVGGAEALRQAGRLVQDDLLIDRVFQTDPFPERRSAAKS